MRAKPWEVFELPSLDRTVEFEIVEPEKPMPKIAVDLTNVPAWRMRPMPPGRRNRQ